MIMFEDFRSWWRRTKTIRAEEAILSNLPRAENIDTSKLRKIDKGEIERILTEPKLHEEWLVLAKEIDQLILFEDMKTGGVNPGDRRALYYLVRALGLKRVLEIGTNVGASTIHIAAAMKVNLLADDEPNKHSLVTVDIADVNHAPDASWRLGALPRSPRDNIEAMGMLEHVTFVTNSSLTYLDECDESFDLIFLDGDHSAATVYQEIPRALRRLRESGFLLLHDFFPKNRPLWSDRAVVPGPLLAVERLIREHANVRVIPLGSLPWPTKLHSNVTSLAMLRAA
jgi:predicted O-methyltransferase YrrM